MSLSPSHARPRARAADLFSNLVIFFLVEYEGKDGGGGKKGGKRKPLETPFEAVEGTMASPSFLSCVFVFIVVFSAP